MKQKEIEEASISMSYNSYDCEHTESEKEECIFSIDSQFTEYDMDK
jgi:hypothetical protein